MTDYYFLKQQNALFAKTAAPFELKKQILRKSVFGLGVYASLFDYGNEIYVLWDRSKGLDLGLCRNKFDEGKRTLHIWLEKCEDILVARHHDMTQTISDGDVFDYAQSCIKKSGKELLIEIANRLQLSFDDNFPGNDLEGVCISSVEKFSWFYEPIFNRNPSDLFSLTDVYYYCLQDDDCLLDVTNKYRLIRDEQQRKEYKTKKFPFCTFSGVFTERKVDFLVKHSNLICFDFDHIGDDSACNDLKSRLIVDTRFQTELLFRSPSGDGLKWIVKVDLSLINEETSKPYTHEEWFNAIATQIEKDYKTKVDPSGKDVSRACFLPYDEDAYINPIYLCRDERYTF